MERYRNACILFRDFCGEHGILCDPDACFEYMNQMPEKEEQLSFLPEGG